MAASHPAMAARHGAAIAPHEACQIFWLYSTDRITRSPFNTYKEVAAQ